MPRKVAHAFLWGPRVVADTLCHQRLRCSRSVVPNSAPSDSSPMSNGMKIPEILQVETSQVPGSLASVLNVIAEAGLVLEHVTTVHREQGKTLWEITVEVESGKEDDLLARLNKLETARF